MALNLIVKKCPCCKKGTEHEIIEGPKNKKILCLVCGRKQFISKDITDEELRNLQLYDLKKFKRGRNDK